jgi:hypothetical protein
MRAAHLSTAQFPDQASALARTGSPLPFLCVLILDCSRTERDV